MDAEHQSSERLPDAEVVQRWMSCGKQIQTALQDSKYEEVIALAEHRSSLLSALEETASRLTDDQRQSLLDDEAELQRSMKQHHEYMSKKLAGLGRMKLGFRKYSGR